MELGFQGVLNPKIMKKFPIIIVEAIKKAISGQSSQGQPFHTSSGTRLLGSEASAGSGRPAVI